MLVIFFHSNQDAGETGFFLACRANNVKAVQHLMKFPDTDIVQPSGRGQTPYQVACVNGCEEIVRILMRDVRQDPNYQLVSVFFRPFLH